MVGASWTADKPITTSNLDFKGVYDSVTRTAGLTTWREALTSTWAEAQMRVQAQSRAMPNVFNVEILSNAQFGRE